MDYAGRKGDGSTRNYKHIFFLIFLFLSVLISGRFSESGVIQMSKIDMARSTDIEELAKAVAFAEKNPTGS